MVQWRQDLHPDVSIAETTLGDRLNMGFQIRKLALPPYAGCADGEAGGRVLLPPGCHLQGTRYAGSKAGLREGKDGEVNNAN